MHFKLPHIVETLFWECHIHISIHGITLIYVFSLQIIECITLIYVFLFENHQNCTEELKLTLFGGMWGGEIQELSNSDEFSTLYSITFSLFPDAIRTKFLFFSQKK